MAKEKEAPRRLTGVGVSSGIVIGKAYLVDRSRAEINHFSITEKEIRSEIRRFKKAIEKSIAELQEIKDKIQDEELKDHLYIIDAYLMLIQDNMLIQETRRIIRKEKVNAEWAISKTINRFVRILEKVEDEYLRGRKSDLEFIGQRIIRNLMGKALESISKIDDKVIVVAHDLSPADTAQMGKDNIMGFVTDMGGMTSHTAIMARALEIPAVVGLETVTRKVNSGHFLIVDGIKGLVVIDPSEEDLREYEKKRSSYESFEKKILQYGLLPAETKDGYRIKIYANIELMEEVPSVIRHGAEGIGLYRTEFLYLNRKGLPTEEEHYAIYKEVLERSNPNPVTIRTLDIGGDKFVSHLDLPEEMNPAMGLRAIRFSLKEIEIFKTQLRGILRASAHGNVRVIFPMISGVQELREVKVIFNEVKEELSKKEVPFNPSIPLGIMIEIPSAASIADLLAREIDFFSIGTNDLIQYALAIDRVNEHVNYLYEPLHPGVLRFIHSVVEAGHNAGIPVAMCGEMAGEPLYAPILLGMGLDELSMNAGSIPFLKKIIRSISLDESKDLVKTVLQFPTAAEIYEYILNRMEVHFPKEFDRIKELGLG